MRGRIASPSMRESISAKAACGTRRLSSIAATLRASASMIDRDELPMMNRFVGYSRYL
jgi:hypothetical protein